LAKVSKENAMEIAAEYLKQQKNAANVEVFTVEENINGNWVVNGTCPIDLAGHQWAEKFEVAVDSKGKIKSASYSLL
jgi:hypothetical protein